MVGILLALQVNNWNENRARNQKLKVHLINLKQSMEKDLISWRSEKKSDIFRYYALQHLLHLAAQPPLKLHSDEKMFPYTQSRNWEGAFPEYPDRQFLSMAFRTSYRGGTLRINTTTIEELKSTGLFSYLGDELKTSLSDFYHAYNWRIGDQKQIILEIRNRWEVALSTSGVVPSDVSNIENPIDLLSNNPERVAILKQLIRQARWRAISANSLEKLGDRLIQEIDEEVSRI